MRQIVHELVPPIAMKAARRLLRGSDADAKELRRLRKATGPTVTNILGRPFKVNEPRDFADLYGTYFQGRVYDFPCTGRPYIIDCGAHVGVSVAWWKTRYPEARVLAFEADTTNFALLEQNCGHLPDVTLIHAAVWTLDGEVMFAAKGGENGRLAAFVDAPSAGPVMTVPGVRLRPFLSEPVDLLKMDIEGAEVDVLADCADRLGPVDRIFVEHHSWVSRGQRLAQTFSILEEAGFRMHANVAGAAPRPFMELGIDLRLQVFAYKRRVHPAMKRPQDRLALAALAPDEKLQH